jgi:hypothetical protein
MQAEPMQAEPMQVGQVQARRVQARQSDQTGGQTTMQICDEAEEMPGYLCCHR